VEVRVEGLRVVHLGLARQGLEEKFVYGVGR